MKAQIVASAILAPLVTLFQLANSVCILHSLRPSNQRLGHYSYYLEMPNGTRVRQVAQVLYDEKREQLIFFHAFLIALVLPGLVMPCLLYLAEKRKVRILFVWFVCWITVHNVHSCMAILTHCLEWAFSWRQIVAELSWERVQQMLTMCTVATVLNACLAPFTIYLSVWMLGHYQGLVLKSNDSLSSSPTRQSQTIRLSCAPLPLGSSAAANLQQQSDSSAAITSSTSMASFVQRRISSLRTS